MKQRIVAFIEGYFAKAKILTDAIILEKTKIRVTKYRLEVAQTSIKVQRDS